MKTRRLLRSLLIIGAFLFTKSVMGQCLQISVTTQDATCGGNDGQITLNITPGTPPNAQSPYTISLAYVDTDGQMTLLANYPGVSFETITFSQGDGTLNIPGADELGIPAAQFYILVVSSGGSVECKSEDVYFDVACSSL